MVVKRYILSFGILVWHGGIEATEQVRPVAAVIQRRSGKDRERGVARDRAMSTSRDILRGEYLGH